MPSDHTMLSIERNQQRGSYRRFAAMILTSTVLMFALTYLSTYQADHIYFSETRVYMSLIMGSMMAVVMLTFMLGMYRQRAINLGIYAGSAIVFALALWLMRSQRIVDDVSYMKAMIPHHSIAVLTSERAQIRDQRVRELADGIRSTQVKEIAQMKKLIADIQEHDVERIQQ